MSLKIMTFNLRIPVEADGINFFPNRRERILEAIRAEAPDLIGFQEAADESRAFLRKALAEEYTVLGCGWNKDFRGESCVIAYRRDRLELVNLTTRFLSDTPLVPGSRYLDSDQSGCPRLFVHAELSVEGGEGTIHWINTHLDHKGMDARLRGMRQILDYAKELNGPLTLTGDMNARPTEACIALARERGLIEATEAISHTFHNFGKIEKDCKIDYIFTTLPVAEAHRVEDTPVEGVYISDHHPLCATLEL